MKSLRIATTVGTRCRLQRLRKHIRLRPYEAGICQGMFYAASAFKMPAMSPTMTEGNIAAWKVKEGASFNAGDILLEIETDKAQMDVEAQDSGVLAKILVPDGAQKVDVGRPIAILADQGDDISALQLPDQEDREPAQAAVEIESETQQKQDTTTIHKDSKSYQLRHDLGNSYSPSVLHLLHQYGIEDPGSIPATGPQGRLLKGDVLAQVGTIAPDIPRNLKTILDKKRGLDTSNVVIQRSPAPSEVEVPTPRYTASASPPLAHIDTIVQFKEPFNVHRDQSEALPLIEKASGKALADVPALRVRRISVTDAIFAELVGEPPSTSKYQKPLSQKPLYQGLNERFTSSGKLNPKELHGSLRIDNIFGTAILHFEPVKTIKWTDTRSDIFDSILGIAQIATEQKNLRAAPRSEDIRVRLEYDDTAIATDTATEYLARFQHHLEHPDLA